MKLSILTQSLIIIILSTVLNFTVSDAKAVNLLLEIEDNCNKTNKIIEQKLKESLEKEGYIINRFTNGLFFHDYVLKYCISVKGTGIINVHSATVTSTSKPKTKRKGDVLLRKNNKVTILEEKDNYFHVEFDHNGMTKEGWIRNNQLTISPKYEITYLIKAFEDLKDSFQYRYPVSDIDSNNLTNIVVSIKNKIMEHPVENNFSKSAKDWLIAQLEKIKEDKLVYAVYYKENYRDIADNDNPNGLIELDSRIINEIITPCREKKPIFGISGGEALSDRKKIESEGLENYLYNKFFKEGGNNPALLKIILNKINNHTGNYIKVKFDVKTPDLHREQFFYCCVFLRNNAPQKNGEDVAEKLNPIPPAVKSPKESKKENGSPKSSECFDSDEFGFPFGCNYSYQFIKTEKSYNPADLVEIGEYKGYKLILRKKVAEALKEMQNAASQKGITLEIRDAGRTWGTQAYRLKQYGQTVAEKPGYSEHQLYTSIDIIDAGRKSNISDWLKENAYRFGFIATHSKQIGNIRPEPWHWRYVGKELSEKYYRERG